MYHKQYNKRCQVQELSIRPPLWFDVLFKEHSNRDKTSHKVSILGVNTFHILIEVLTFPGTLSFKCVLLITQRGSRF